MFDLLFSFIDETITTNISTMVGIFSSTITPLIGACVVLYVVYLFYQSFYDPQNLIVMESIKFIVSLSLVTFIAFNTQWYQDNIVPAVLGSGDQIAHELLGGTSGGSASLQSIFDTMILQVIDIFKGMNFDLFETDTYLDTIYRLIMVLLTIIGFVPFLAICTAYLLVAKIMVSFLLIIGPLFIMLAFFPSTRSFFQAWTGQCFNYTLLSIMYPLAFTMFIQVLDNTVFSQNLSLATVFMTVIIFAALILLALQIPAFCSTLSGGVGINGLTGGVLSGLSSLKSLGIGKGVGAGLKAMKSAGSAIKNISKGTIKPG